MDPACALSYSGPTGMTSISTGIYRVCANHVGRLYDVGMVIVRPSCQVPLVLVDGACVEHCPRTKVPVAGKCIRDTMAFHALDTEIPLCVVELPGVSRQISQAVGFVGSRSFRAASRSVAQKHGQAGLRTIQQTLPGLLWCSKIYVLSAWNGRPEALSIFCPSSSRFEKVPLLKHLDPYYAVASRAGNLYVLMSGEDPVKAGIEWRSSFHCWQPAHGQWRRLPSRPGEETTRFALTAAGSAVYALGGIGRRGCSAATDRFDLHRARWEALPPLASPRCDAAAVAKGSVVFLLGGTDRLGEALVVNTVFKVVGTWNDIKSTDERSPWGLISLLKALQADTSSQLYQSPFFKFVDRAAMSEPIPVRQCSDGVYRVFCSELRTASGPSDGLRVRWIRGPYNGGIMSTGEALGILFLGIAIVPVALSCLCCTFWHIDMDKSSSMDVEDVLEKMQHDPSQVDAKLQIEYACSWLEGRFMGEDWQKQRQIIASVAYS
eukprot:g17133.t1